jgi:catechol 2,3-dioxygenase-like lactoylglutathione lyase family enzyme
LDSVRDDQRMRPSKQGLDVNVCIRDIDRSLGFYVDALGLEVVEQYPSGLGTTHRLRFGDSFVKLTDPTTPPGGEPGPVGIDGAVGLRAITFQVDDFEDCWNAVVATGAPIHMEHTSYPKSGIQVGMVLDPDGNVVELLQRGEPWE